MVIVRAMTNRIAELRIKAGLSQEALGARVHTSGQQIGHLESGRRKLSEDWMRKIAAALGVLPHELLAEAEGGPAGGQSPPEDDVILAENVRVPQAHEMPRDLPVLGTAAGAKSETDGAVQLIGGVIDRVRRPPALADVHDAYALYVINDSMEPALPAGETLIVHPHKPVRPRDNVVIQVRGEDGELYAYVKRLVRQTSQEIICEQHNPPKQVVFPRKSVERMHRILSFTDLISY